MQQSATQQQPRHNNLAYSNNINNNNDINCDNVDEGNTTSRLTNIYKNNSNNKLHSTDTIKQQQQSADDEEEDFYLNSSYNKLNRLLSRDARNKTKPTNFLASYYDGPTFQHVIDKNLVNLPLQKMNRPSIINCSNNTNTNNNDNAVSHKQTDLFSCSDSNIKTLTNNNYREDSYKTDKSHNLSREYLSGDAANKQPAKPFHMQLTSKDGFLENQTRSNDTTQSIDPKYANIKNNNLDQMMSTTSSTSSQATTKSYEADQSEESSALNFTNVKLAAMQNTGVAVAQFNGGSLTPPAPPHPHPHQLQNYFSHLQNQEQNFPKTVSDGDNNITPTTNNNNIIPTTSNKTSLTKPPPPFNMFNTVLWSLQQQQQQLYQMQMLHKLSRQFDCKGAITNDHHYQPLHHLHHQQHHPHQFPSSHFPIPRPNDSANIQSLNYFNGKLNGVPPVSAALDAAYNKNDNYTMNDVKVDKTNSSDVTKCVVDNNNNNNFHKSDDSDGIIKPSNNNGETDNPIISKSVRIDSGNASPTKCIMKEAYEAARSDDIVSKYINPSFAMPQQTTFSNFSSSSSSSFLSSSSSLTSSSSSTLSLSNSSFFNTSSLSSSLSTSSLSSSSSLSTLTSLSSSSALSSSSSSSSSFISPMLAMIDMSSTRLLQQKILQDSRALPNENKTYENKLHQFSDAC
ncbi:hypothetical protein HELRODRAFT_179444 [Helobdella robusta]|uniref:Uncharacterized protein n=1 Tax=Helobdella robusta TaxID=6412 RepID=T1FEQ3_HELRO|nr:hypothetical protein HELRODRAFT_179444 [Helobdella robusta]ESN95373.1 hypothetical protein HELRODRAFT_179444 [Helobdella robusta]